MTAVVYSLGHYEEPRFHTSVHYVFHSLIEHRYNNSKLESVLATTIMGPPFPYPSHPFRPRFGEAATRAHLFPVIFGNFHPFTRSE